MHTSPLLLTSQALPTIWHPESENESLLQLGVVLGTPVGNLEFWRSPLDAHWLRFHCFDVPALKISMSSHCHSGYFDAH